MRELINYNSEVQSLEGTKDILFQPMVRGNRLIKVDGDEWRWGEELTFMHPAYRSVKGSNNTFYVLDIDISLIKSFEYHEKVFKKSNRGFENLYSDVERREIFLKIATDLANEILEVDPDFMVYFSGKGIYLIRIIPFRTDLRNVYKHVFNLVKACSCKDDSHLAEWHVNHPQEITDMVKIVPHGNYFLQATIDSKMFKGADRNLFRLPYSIYSKFIDTYICTPAVIEGGLVNYESTLLLSKFSTYEVKDYVIPRISTFPQDEYTPTKEELDAIDEQVFEKYTKGEQQIGTLYYNYENVPIVLRETMKVMLYLISDPDTNVTPPCIYRAYNIVTKQRSGGNEHFLRVVIGRYLRSMYHIRGEENGNNFTNNDLANFFIHNINNEEDNLGKNRKKLLINMRNFIIPKHVGDQQSSFCGTHQQESHQYYCCGEEEKNNCSRTRPSFYNHNKDTIELDMIDDEPVENTISEDYKNTLKKVVDIMSSNAHTIINKTTRAGLTTSSVIANQHLAEQRLLVVVPTTNIAQTTFPQAVALASNYPIPKIHGGVLTSNAQSCVILKVEQEQHRRKWNERNEVSYLSKLPYNSKPTCGTCHFKTQTYDIRDGLIIDSEILDQRIFEFNVRKAETTEMAMCSHISLSNDLHKGDVVFITYSKLLALGISQNKENQRLWNKLLDFDKVLFDESSHILNLNHKTLVMKRVNGNKSEIYINAIAEQVTILKNQIFEDEKDFNNKKLNLAYLLVKELELFFATMLIRLDGKEVAIRTSNPLSDEQKVTIYTLYRQIQKYVKKNNVNLILLADVLVISQTSDWFFDKTVDKDNIKTVYQMHTSPDDTILRKFMQEMVADNKQILLTDATPSFVDMGQFLSIPFEINDFGDPRNIDKMSLIVSDNKKTTISYLTSSKTFEPLNDVNKFIREVTNKFGAKNVFVIFPNVELCSAFKWRFNKNKEYDDVLITYYRSSETVGVASERRVMVSVGNPLPPPDSVRYLANFLHEKNKNMNIESDIDQLQQNLVQDSANSSFFQGIGRVKCPQGKQRSVVFLYGMKHDEAKSIIEKYSANYIYHREADSVNIMSRIKIGEYWRMKGQLTSIKFFEMISTIRSSPKKGVKLKTLKSLLSDRDYNNLISKETLETYQLFYNLKTKSITTK